MASVTTILKATDHGGRIRPVKEVFHHPHIQLADSFDDAFKAEKIMLCGLKKREKSLWHACVLHSYDSDANTYVFKNSYPQHPEIRLSAKDKIPQKAFHVCFEWTEFH